MNGPFWLWSAGDFVQPLNRAQTPKPLSECHVYRVEQAEGSDPTTQQVQLRGVRQCFVCGERCRTSQAKMCPRCMRIRDRWGSGKAARTVALQNAWSPELRAFVCHYSGAILTEDPSSPWHVSFDHGTPGDERDLVVCAALVNHFKSNLTEQEFRFVVVQLGERFTGARKRIDTFQPMHWGRSVKLYG